MHKQQLVLQGQAEATEIRISGKLPGRIDTFFVQEGDWVHQGDTLVVINSPEVHAKYQQVNALEQVAVQQNKKIDAGTRRQIVATALQLWNKTKSDLTLAQTTYNRILTLYKDSVVTSQRKDEVEAMYKAAVAAERAAYEQYQMAVDGAQKEDKASAASMGLERLAVIVQDVDSLFTVDTNKALLDRVCELAHTEYQKDHETDISLRIVADHIKSCTFMISDGIMPSNEGRGYVLRRLLRRAARHGKKLGIEGEFLAALSRTVIDLSKDGYPELEEKSAMIFKVLSEEEDKFNRTIDQGLAILADMEEDMNKKGEKVLSGDNAFKLYDTYGFPIDLTREILEEKSLGIDEDGFNAAMKRQKEQARAARKTTNYMGADAGAGANRYFARSG